MTLPRTTRQQRRKQPIEKQKQKPMQPPLTEQELQQPQPEQTALPQQLVPLVSFLHRPFPRVVAAAEVQLLICRRSHRAVRRGS